MTGLTSHALTSLFSMVDEFASMVGGGQVTMIYDASKDFAGIEHVYGVQRRARPSIVAFDNAARLRLGLKHLVGVCPRQSHDTPLIQAADFLLRVIVMHALDIAEGKTPPDDLVELADFWFPPLLSEVPKLADYVMADEVSRQFAGVWGKSSRERGGLFKFRALR
jgi:hypothetical protein